MDVIMAMLLSGQLSRAAQMFIMGHHHTNVMFAHHDLSGAWQSGGSQCCGNHACHSLFIDSGSSSADLLTGDLARHVSASQQLQPCFACLPMGSLCLCVLVPASSTVWVGAAAAQMALFPHGLHEEHAEPAGAQGRKDAAAAGACHHAQHSTHFDCSLRAASSVGVECSCMTEPGGGCKQNGMQGFIPINPVSAGVHRAACSVQSGVSAPLEIMGKVGRLEKALQVEQVGSLCWLVVQGM